MTTGMSPMLSIVRDALGADARPERKVVLALSGGMDSIVLLHLLTQLRQETAFELRALHVHHGLSPHADAWVAFCQDTCRVLDVPLEVAYVSLGETAGKGIERTAREARYAAFAAVSADVLCLAHHQNDRAETVLLNLFRGAGVRGLAALPDERPFSGKRLLRPLLNVPRHHLATWAEAQGLQWIEDESNQNLHYRRNYIRHVVLPAVAKPFPGVLGVLARTALYMSEQADLLDRLARIEGEACRSPAGALSVVLLKKLPPVAMRNVLRYGLEQAGIRIPAARCLGELASQLSCARPDAAIAVRLGVATAHIWRDQVWLDTPIVNEPPACAPLVFGTSAWPEGSLRVEALSSEDMSLSDLSLSAVGSGMKFRPSGRCHGNVSDLLREKNVPPWVRSRLPAVRLHGKLIWIAGLGWSNEASQYAGQLRLRWQADIYKVL